MVGGCTDFCLKIEGAINGFGAGKNRSGISPYDKGYTYCSHCQLYYPPPSVVEESTNNCKCCGTRLRRKSRNRNRKRKRAMAALQATPFVANIIWQ